MRFLAAFLVLAFMALPVAARDGAAIAKDRLISHLETGITESGLALTEMQKALKSGDLQIASDPRSFVANAHDHIKALDRFLTTVRTAPPAGVAGLLRDTFASCDDRGACLHGLTPDEITGFVTVHGAGALGAIYDTFATLDPWRREAALYAGLRIDPRPCPGNILDAAMSDPVFRVRAAGLALARGACDGADFTARLNTLLEKEASPEFLFALLEQIPADSPHNALLFPALINLVEQGRIPVASSFGMLCSAMMKDAPAGAKGPDAAFWVRAFHDHENRRACIAENIFLKVRTASDLLRMSSIMQAAADHAYGFGSTKALYGSGPATSYWNAAPGLDRKILELFRTGLGSSDLRTLTEALPSGGARLVAAGWLGQDPAVLLPAKATLLIQVRDAATGSAITQHQEIVVRGRPFALTLPAADGLPPITHTGTLGFDLETMRYVINDFLVGLHPHGAGMRAEIPFGGKFEADLQTGRRSLRWTITLAD